ncbi:16807_t:CDS:2, partial [Funneliformis geosporum]
MISATECRLENHKKKSTLDFNLKLDKHRKNIHKAENKIRFYQTTLNINNNGLNECEVINTALVKPFTQADIPLEKVDKLQDFFVEM